MGKFNAWLDENHIELRMYHPSQPGKAMYTARAKNENEVKSHLVNAKSLANKHGHSMHISVEHKGGSRWGEVESHKVHPDS